jgi:voltage-gated potassium channel
MRALRNVRFLSAALLCVVLIGTAGFHYIEHWSWFDGFYMVLTTLTTIGYGEVHPLSPLGRYFNVVIILAGVVLVFLILGALGQALLEIEFNNLFGRRRMQREIERLQGHYIICGAGRVGRAVARQLQSNAPPAPFIILEGNEAKAEKIRQETGWLIVHSDATQESQLRAARIEQAAGLVAATSTDASNIFVILTARSLNPKLKIISRASEEDAEKHMRTAGADLVISPYGFAGYRIAQSFLRPNVTNFLELAFLRTGSEMGLEVEELRIDSASIYVGQGLRASRIRHDLGVIVLAIQHEGGEMKYGPEADAKLCAQDRLIVMGEPSRLRQLETLAGAKK